MNLPQTNRTRITALVLVFSLSWIVTGFLVNTPGWKFLDSVYGEWKIIHFARYPDHRIILPWRIWGRPLFNAGLVTLMGLSPLVWPG